MNRSLNGQLPLRVVLDTNIVLCGALSPGSDSARLAELNNRVSFYVPHQVEVELWRRIAEHGRDDLHRAAVSALVDRYLAEVGAIRLSSPPKSSPQKIDDPAIISDASRIGAAVCTYNLKHFTKKVATVTPVSLLRTANFAAHLVEKPERADIGTFLYLIRAWNKNALGTLLEFHGGNAVVGTEGRQIEVHSTVDGQVQIKRCKEPLPNGQLHGLVIRFASNGELAIDIWHPSRSRGILSSKNTGDSGDRPLWRQGPQSHDLLLDRFWRPKRCECFGISTVPEWRSPKSIANGVRAETLEASIASEDDSDLISKVRVIDTDSEFAFALTTGSDRRTRFLPASNWIGGDPRTT